MRDDTPSGTSHQPGLRGRVANGQGEPLDERAMFRDRVAASMRLPYPPYLRQVVRRSVGMWLLVRIAYVFVLMAAMMFLGLLSFAEGTAAALHPGGAARAVLVALTAVLVWWDRKRSHELLLSANLGVWPGWFWAASMLIALVLDVAVQTVLGAL